MIEPQVEQVQYRLGRWQCLASDLMKNVMVIEQRAIVESGWREDIHKTYVCFPAPLPEPEVLEMAMEQQLQLQEPLQQDWVRQGLI